jgi:NADH-quinone oxidoreductase subunit N
MDSLSIKTFFAEIFLTSGILFGLMSNPQYVSKGVTYPQPLKITYIQTLFILLIVGLLTVNNYAGSENPSFFFIKDDISTFCALLTVLSAVAVFITGQENFLKLKINLFEFYSVTLLSLLSLMILASSVDLMSLYLGLEMQTLCFYILAALLRYSAFSTEAGLKYFVSGAFISAIFLFGASITYGLTGTTSYTDYALLFHSLQPENQTLLICGVLTMTIALFFKVSAVPFHIWAPDVYEGSPFSSTLVFILLPKFISFIVLFRLTYTAFFSLFESFQIFFLACGILSVFVGSLMALRQKRYKRLLIYSSISHVGFLLLGSATGTIYGVTSVIYYLIFYLINSLTVWGIVSVLMNSQSSSYIADFRLRNHPLLGLTHALGLFSFAGIPPLVGFSTKFFIFQASLHCGLIIPSVIVVIASVIGAFYYLRVIKIIYFENQGQTSIGVNKTYGFDFFKAGSQATYTLISISAFILVTLFINPDFFLGLSYKLALSLLTF